MISNFGEFYRLANYLHRHTTKLIGLVMGVPTLREIFEEKYYTHLAGGILESFGRMFKNDLKLYVYPLLDPDAGVVGDRRRLPGRAASSSTSTTSWSRTATSSRSATTSRNSCGIFSRDVYRKLQRRRPDLGRRRAAQRRALDLPAPPAGLRPREVRFVRRGILVVLIDSSTDRPEMDSATADAEGGRGQTRGRSGSDQVSGFFQGKMVSGRFSCQVVLSLLPSKAKEGKWRTWGQNLFLFLGQVKKANFDPITLLLNINIKIFYKFIQ